MSLFIRWVGLFLFVAMCCAVCGGVTVNGQHHQVGCSCSKGVVIQ
jgi:hypothetical protein